MLSSTSRHLVASLLLLLGTLLASESARAVAPVTEIGLAHVLERAIRNGDAESLRELHSWDGVAGRDRTMSESWLRRLLEMEINSVTIEPDVDVSPRAGLRYNVALSGMATVEFLRPDGSTAEVKLPFGEQDGRLFLAVLVADEPASSPVALTEPRETFLVIDVHISESRSDAVVRYDIACVVETARGERTVTYTADSGTIRRLVGQRFKSCGMRVIDARQPGLELRLHEGDRLVYRSGRVAGPATVMYPPRT